MTLNDLCSYEILLKILSECQYLCYLTDLNFRSCSFSNLTTNFQLIIDKIWSLPKLTDYHSDININGKKEFDVPTIISSSLTNVSILRSDLQWNQIKPLFNSTPRLTYLSVYLLNLQFMTIIYFLSSSAYRLC